MSMKLPKDNLFYGLAETMTEEQKKFVDAMYSDEYDIIFCNSPAGTGKTTLAVAMAKLLIEEERYKRLVFTFSPVEESKMGFRPGDQFQKDFEYTIPLRQALIEVGDMPERVIDSPEADPKRLKEGGYWVQAMSHTFARGQNLKERVVIIDEAQNWTVGELKKVLTRCHDTAKVIVLGHTGQCDLPNPKHSGFQKFIDHFEGQERAYSAKLTKNFRGWMAQYADTIDDK